ncbi:TPA: hypothetical protein SMR42_000401 [Pseudomonas putida]|nr:hypothetical protein [Pseudomonas putida]
MSTTIHTALAQAVNTSAFDANERRAFAVAAALEVVAAQARSADGKYLEGEFNNLSRYADQIQEALGVR